MKNNSFISFLATLCFLVFNLVIGLLYKSSWNLSISIYYFIVFLVSTFLNYYSKKSLHDEEKISIIKKESFFLIALDVTLIIPISLMVLSKRRVYVGMIMAIAIAAYTIFKVVMFIINRYKAKNIDIIKKGIMVVELKEIFVSILCLQSTLLTVFSNGKSVLMLSAFTSTFLYICSIDVSLYQIIKIVPNASKWH